MGGAPAGQPPAGAAAWAVHPQASRLRATAARTRATWSTPSICCAAFLAAENGTMLALRMPWPLPALAAWACAWLIQLSAAGRKLKAKAAPVPGCMLEAAQCSLSELRALTRQVQQLRDRLQA
eukprot:gene1860-2626_t